MEQYVVNQALESVITYMAEHQRVQKIDLVNLLREKGEFNGSFELCSKLVEWFKIQKYLKVSNPFYGYLRLTDKAKVWLNTRSKVIVYLSVLQGIKENYQLFMGLKLIRKAIAEERGIDLFKVCPNYMLEKLAYYQPETLDSLFKIRGFKEWDGDTQWHRYLEVIQDWKAREKAKDYSLSA